MKNPLIHLLALTASAMLHGESPRGVRTWTDTTGRTLQAALHGFDSGQVALQFPDGKITRLQAAQLSEADREFIMRHIAEVFDPITGKEVPMSGAVKHEEMSFTAGRSWPSSLTATRSLLFAREAGYDKERQCQKFRTRRFEYLLHSGVAISDELARVFEGTYELLRSSPLGIQARPQDDFFRVEVFARMADYHSGGGPEGSAGVYLINERIFKLPLQSLGLMLPPGYRLTDPARQMATLIHEMTHMMMHDVLDLLPMWFIEGSAEYTGCIPYVEGVFMPPKVAEGVEREMNRPLRTGFGNQLLVAPLLPLHQLLELNMRQWHEYAITGEVTPAPGPTTMPVGRSDPLRMASLYKSSLLLTYYFMNLEGDKKGTRLLQYLEAVRKEQPRWNAWREELFRYIAAREEFMKKPGVTKLPDGTFTYPTYLNPPPPPVPPRPEYASGEVFKIHLPILLNGKTAEEVVQGLLQTVSTQGLMLPR
jgi:hypothetical protein